jgi:predicted  nucleic acid-binding Zn-ribbon protein
MKNKKNGNNKMTVTKICVQCGDEYEAGSLRSRYCSPACKQKAYRERKKRQAAEVANG